MTVACFHVDKFLQWRLETCQLLDMPPKRSEPSINPTWGYSEHFAPSHRWKYWTAVQRRRRLGGSTALTLTDMASITQSSPLPARQPNEQPIQKLNKLSELPPSLPAKAGVWHTSDAAQQEYLYAASPLCSQTLPAHVRKFKASPSPLEHHRCRWASVPGKEPWEEQPLIFLSRGARDVVLADQRGSVPREGHTMLASGGWRCCSS